MRYEYSMFELRDLEFLVGIVGPENVSTDEAELLANAADAYPGRWVKPNVVVWPEDSSQVSRIVRYANERRIPIVPRGAGSSLSGNVIPLYGGIVINTRRMDRIVEIREGDLQVTVQPGVIYDKLNEALRKYNLFFPPDPASSAVCTIGGMVGNNSSGLRAVKYGVTKDYVLRLEAVLPNGQIIRVGSYAVKSSTGYDLVRLLVGSEGTLGVVTEITLKLRTLPEAVKTATVFFDSTDDATESVSEVMGSGLLPAAIEFLDRQTIAAVKKYKGIGLKEASAMLLVELDGPKEAVAHEMDRAVEIFRRHNASEINVARDEEERKQLWAARKAAYPALFKLAPSVITGDVVVPVSKLTKLVDFAYRIGEEYGVGVLCFGHSGDGNVHPNIMADRSDQDLWSRAQKVNEEIVRYAISLGGSSSGEHGIGIEKKAFMEFEHGASLELMRQIKKLIDPNNIMNPGKFFD